RVEGVSAVSVNLATDRASVTFDPGETDPASLTAAVKTAGYDVGESDVVLPVTGMTCASCVRRVERALAKVDGVESVNVNLATEEATVRTIAGAADRDALVAAVERAGYGVRPQESPSSAETAEDAREAEK